MARYFIHIRNGDGLQRDENGQEFASGRIAAADAARTAGALIHDEFSRDGRNVSVEMTVENDRQEPIATISASIASFDNVD